MCFEPNLCEIILCSRWRTKSPVRERSWRYRLPPPKQELHSLPFRMWCHCRRCLQEEAGLVQECEFELLTFLVFVLSLCVDIAGLQQLPGAGHSGENTPGRAVLLGRPEVCCAGARLDAATGRWADRGVTTCPSNGNITFCWVRLLSSFALFTWVSKKQVFFFTEELG